MSIVLRLEILAEPVRCHHCKFLKTKTLPWRADRCRLFNEDLSDIGIGAMRSSLCLNASDGSVDE